MVAEDGVGTLLVSESDLLRINNGFYHEIHFREFITSKENLTKVAGLGVRIPLSPQRKIEAGFAPAFSIFLNNSPQSSTNFAGIGVRIPH